MSWRHIPGPVLWAIAGAVAFYVFWPQAAPPEATYPTVIVRREAIEALEPDTVVRVVDRIRFVRPDPIQIAVAPQAALEPVAAFCRPVVIAVTGDTAAAPGPRRLLLRSGSFDGSPFPFRAGELTLTGLTNDGDLVQGRWGVRGDHSFVTSGDSVIVRHDRWWWVKELLGYGSAAAFGYGLRVLTGG